MNTAIEQDDITIETPSSQVALPESSSFAVALAKAEVDQQIMTARSLPRKPVQVAQEIMRYVTMDHEMCEECMFALPRAGNPVRGPSIRFAEIVANSFGNCRSAARIVHVDRIEKFVEAEGMFQDLEKNSASTSRVRRRIFDKKGRLFSDDMIMVTGNAAGAIAKRNAILSGVPKPVWRHAYQAVEKTIAGDNTPLNLRRDKAVKAFATFGVTPEEICAALGVASVDNITVDHITTLMGMHTGLVSGEANVEDMFPRTTSGERQDLGARLDTLAESPKESDLPPHDPETGGIYAETADTTDKLLAAARARATQGGKVFTRWLAALSAADYERIQEHLPALRALADQKS
jgi:hypothetical protein